MSYFLWIEDFASQTGGEDIAYNVLGGIIEPEKLSGDKKKLRSALKTEGVFIELNFGNGLDFIQNRLSDIDFIILDMNLPAYSGSLPNANVLKILEKWHGYKSSNVIDEVLLGQSTKELQDIAGYHLYTQLIFNLGFPENHILFCSNHGSDLASIKKAFTDAKIELPIIYTKDSSDDKEKVQTWVKNCYENPYSRLRRGIIEGCRYLIDKKIRFSHYSADKEKPVEIDMENYLEILKAFLPLREPADTAALYKLFVRTLAHEWDDSVKPTKLENQQVTFAFSWIMKITRNWSAHTHVFDNLQAKDVAFLFVVNMRAMFDLGSDINPYEEHLLKLFDAPMNVDEFKEVFGKTYRDRKIPLTQKYALLIDKYGNNYEASSFHDLLNELQKKKTVNDGFLMQGLYQVFWFLTSNGFVYIDRHKIQDQKYLNYRFAYFDYGIDEYLLEIGRHIYNNSFPEA